MALVNGRTWKTPPEPCCAGTHAYVGCPDGNWKCSGEWLGPGEGSPLIGVLADVESGVWVGAGPII